MMHRVWRIVWLAALAWPLNAAPPEIGGGEAAAGSVAGDWSGYWLRGKRIAGKTGSVFRLTPTGEWHVAAGEKAEKKGTFRAVDGAVLFRFDVIPPGAEAGSELLAPLVDADSFLLRNEGQPDAVVYRRISALPVLGQKDVKGEWKVFEEDPAGKRKEAGFGFEFDGSGGYHIVKYDKNKAIPEAAGKGTYALSGDELILANRCNAAPWNALRFFKVFDDLVLDTPRNIVYAEKQ